jgi:hypothetical protein
MRIDLIKLTRYYAKIKRLSPDWIVQLAEEIPMTELTELLSRHLKPGGKPSIGQVHTLGCPGNLIVRTLPMRVGFRFVGLIS